MSKFPKPGQIKLPEKQEDFSVREIIRLAEKEFHFVCNDKYPCPEAIPFENLKREIQRKAKEIISCPKDGLAKVIRQGSYFLLNRTAASWILNDLCYDYFRKKGENFKGQQAVAEIDKLRSELSPTKNYEIKRKKPTLPSENTALLTACLNEAKEQFLSYLFIDAFFNFDAEQFGLDYVITHAEAKTTHSDLFEEAQKRQKDLRTYFTPKDIDDKNPLWNGISKQFESVFSKLLDKKFEQLLREIKSGQTNR